MTIVNSVGDLMLTDPEAMRAGAPTRGEPARELIAGDELVPWAYAVGDGASLRGNR
jgi:hypothetical protein